MSLIVATKEETEKAIAITAAVSEIVGGRTFVLVVDGGPDGVGDIFSNVVTEGGDPIELLENGLEALKAVRGPVDALRGGRPR
jgi:hypothetical protein